MSIVTCKLINTLKNSEIDDQDVRIIAYSFWLHQAIICVDNQYSKEIAIKQEVQQRRQVNSTIKNLRNVDDKVLLANSLDSLQQLVVWSCLGIWNEN